MQLAMSCVLHIAGLFLAAEGLRTRGRATNNEAFTFDDFVRGFSRTYEAGSEEYVRRAAIFHQSLLQIRAQNSRTGSSWTAGVHAYMDWTDAERASRLHGYDPSTARRAGRLKASLGVLETGTELSIEALGGDLEELSYGSADDSFEAKAPPVRNQGGACGSCWAVAAIEAVEAQLMKDGSGWPQEIGEPRLSAQALLDCVQNPRHCGGSGGCEGATPELAFDFMQANGVPLESDFPYKHETDKCSIEPYPADWVHVTLAGWRALPTNQAQPLMQALVKDGPVAVAVDPAYWYNYHYGVFDKCRKDSVPAHSVLTIGYGGDEDQKYWRLQNSWGDTWGEGGTIRIIRHDDEDNWCGIDSRPQDGSACADEPPHNITVCGSCGILYDALIPQVGRIVLPDLKTAEADVERDAAHHAAANAGQRQSVRTPAPQPEDSAVVPPLDQQRLVEQRLVDPQAWRKPWASHEADEATDEADVASEAASPPPMQAPSIAAPELSYVSAADSVTNAPAGDAPFIDAASEYQASTRLFDKLLRGLSNPGDVARAQDEMRPLSDVSLVPLPANGGTADELTGETIASLERHEALRSAKTIDATPVKVETPTLDVAAETSRPQVVADGVHFAGDFASDADSLIPAWRSETQGDLHSYLR